MAAKPGDYLGSIDAGSNAIRFSIYKLTHQLKLVPVIQKRYPVRLGAGTFTTGALAEADISAAIEAFVDIATTAAEYNVLALPAAATSAIREASNAQAFLNRVRGETGIDLQAISGEEEAALAATGVSLTVDDDKDVHIIIDVGGGSTEVIMATCTGGIIANASLPLGAVRVAQQAGMPEKFNDHHIARIQQTICDGLAMLEKDAAVSKAHEPLSGILVGGTAHALARLAVQIGLRPDSRELSLPDLDECKGVLVKSDIADLTKLGIDPGRAAIILPGTLILIGVMTCFKISVAAVSNAGVRDGLVARWLSCQG